MNLVDDADNRCVGRDMVGEEGERSLFAGDEEDPLSSAGADSVDGDQGSSRVYSRFRYRLYEQHRAAHERFIFQRADDTANDAGQVHGSVVQVGVIDDTHDRGVDRALMHTRRHACGRAANHDDRLFEAGFDGIDGDDVAAFFVAGGIDGDHQQERAALQPCILACGDDGADYTGEKHRSGR